LFIILIEGFRVDGDTAVLEEEDWAEVARSFASLLLFRNVISVELRYDSSDRDGIMERIYDVVSIPMFE